MASASRMRANRDKFESETAGTSVHRLLSAAQWSMERAVNKALREWGSGRLLDAGCGQRPFRQQAMRFASDYVSLDIESRPVDIDIVADIQAMPFDAGSFDTVLCSEVLEHVPRPRDAIGEISRVLRPGGVAIVTVPHLSRIHEAPHDYYRFTRYGLSFLAGAAGMDVLAVIEFGSLFGFIAHQAATVFTIGTWNIPIARWFALSLTTAFLTFPAMVLDMLPGMRSLLPLGYLLVAKRPDK